jgi:hypothetical protein
MKTEQMPRAKRNLLLLEVLELRENAENARALGPETHGDHALQCTARIS